MTAWLQWANVIAAAIMGGGLLIVLAVLIPTFRRAPDHLSLRLHMAVDHYIERLLPPVTVVAAAAAVAVLAVHEDLSAPVAALTSAGLAGCVVVALVSHLVNRRMNLRLRTFSTDAVPPEYAQIRRRWDRFHFVRTLAGVAAYACFVVALVIR